MDVTVQHNPDEERYELLADDGRMIGKVDYHEAAGVITMWHTEVDRVHGGRGLGGVLAKGALDDARSRGLTVRPTCPFIARYIERHPDYADLMVAGADTSEQS